MDTPERSRICTPISKFEDSPVFNYINSLSPIKPVKSINISQTFNSLSFGSPPSVFTSPHVSSQKESRFLRRQFFSESSKSGLASENGCEVSTSVTAVETVQMLNSSNDPPQILDLGSAIKELETPNKNLELAAELPRSLKFDCGSPENNSAPRRNFETDPSLEISLSSTPVRQFVQGVPLERCSSFKSGGEVQVETQDKPTKEEEVGSDWENLISDAAGLLVFADAEAKEQDQNNVSLTSLEPKHIQDSSDDLPTTQLAISIGSCMNDNAENTATRSAAEQKETNQLAKELPSTSHNQQVVEFRSEKLDDKAEIDCKQQRGTRRRCLQFETAGGVKRKFEDSSHSSASISDPEGKISSDDKQLIPFKSVNSSSPCMLPGIGLHLNALAATTTDNRVIKHETLASGRQVISMSTRISSLHSVLSEQNPKTESFPFNSIERDVGTSVNEEIMQDSSQRSAFGVREDYSESCSPKKRRRTLEPAEEVACKRCNCKKSKCLKLYCECFAAGVYCVEPCSCMDCFNKPIHEDTVLATRKQIESRNPLAFAPKVIRSSEPVFEVGEEPNKTPASARHKKGCNCKKSSCLKKYCECFQGGVGCSINCRCESCKNVFGTKDGSVPIVDGEPGAEDPETCRKDVPRKSLHISGVRNDKEEEYPDHVPITPFQVCRMSVQLEFSSSLGKPPRSSIFQAGSSSRTTLKRSDILPTPLKLEKHFQTVPEEETPEVLQSNSSPIRSVKTSSPNRKRVSPPHGRTTRKLVLQSIPSFPSLTYHENDDLQ